jgi:hypothetical protein
MNLERRGAFWSALFGTVGAGIVVLVLGHRYSANPSVFVGFGVGVALVGFVLSVVMTGWLFVAGGDQSLYSYPGTVSVASVLMLVAAGTEPTGGDPTIASIALVGGAILVILGYSLVLLEQFRSNG